MVPTSLSELNATKDDIVEILGYIPADSAESGWHSRAVPENHGFRSEKKQVFPAPSAGSGTSQRVPLPLPTV